MASKTLMQETNQVTTLDGDERFIVADDPSGTPVDGYVTASTIAGGAEWQGVTDAWAYASATTITVPSDATLKYQPGDKIRLEQGGAFKYWVVYSVAATVITIIETTDYTLANSAITDVAFSRVANPFGFPDWFNYTPTLVGFSANPTSVVYRYKASGRMISVVIRQSTDGTSNGTTFTFTPPALPATVTNGAWHGTASGVDNGAVLATTVRLLLVASQTTILAFSDGGTGAWTASAGKRIASGSIEYEF